MLLNKNNLKHLDVSFNKFTIAGLKLIILSLRGKNFLSLLNIEANDK